MTEKSPSTPEEYAKHIIDLEGPNQYPAWARHLFSYLRFKTLNREEADVIAALLRAQIPDDTGLEQFNSRYQPDQLEE